ncbi:MAG TPA: hypothetical protein ENI87_08410 [bacterium]|nr:hypothetical protein [bacterium]
MKQILFTLASVAAFSLHAATQQTPAGYSATTIALPAGAGNVLTLPSGTVSFDGFDLELTTPSGATQKLLRFASYTFGSFVEVIDGNDLLFGESSAGTIWRVPLTGGLPQQLTSLTFNYDAVVLDDARALVSAKTGGFSAPDNDVVLLDLDSGATQMVAAFPGASGPLAIDDDGDVYYATAPSAFPAPAGTVSVLRIDRTLLEQAIANGTVLGLANAHTVVSGLDAAGDLAFDDDGDLFFTDWFQGAIGEIDDADQPNAALAPAFLDYSGAGYSAGSLQFVSAPAVPGAAFEPFQPAGSRLVVYETDYASINQLRVLRGQRADLTTTATSPVPAGSFQISLAAGPANGFALLLFAPTTAAGVLPLSVAGFEQPLLLDQAVAASPATTSSPLDNAGGTTWTLANPGFAPAIDATFQAVFASPAGQLGTTAALSLQVSQ